MPLLGTHEVAHQLATLPGWTLAGNAIRKQFTFAGFPEAIAFLQRLVPECEATDHHPDITVNYRRVTLSFTTHSEGGLTLKDFDGARAAERNVAP